MCHQSEQCPQNNNLIGSGLALVAISNYGSHPSDEGLSSHNHTLASYQGSNEKINTKKQADTQHQEQRKRNFQEIENRQNQSIFDSSEKARREVVLKVR
jgi:hypothetical protein